MNDRPRSRSGSQAAARQRRAGDRLRRVLRAARPLRRARARRRSRRRARPGPARPPRRLSRVRGGAREPARAARTRFRLLKRGLKMNTTKYLIVGAGMTGDMAAKGIREHDSDGSITMIGADPPPTYKRPLLTKGLWQGAPEEKLWRDAAEGVELVT